MQADRSALYSPGLPRLQAQKSAEDWLESWDAHLSLRSFIGFTLISTVTRAAIIGSPPFDNMVERFRAPRCGLPSLTLDIPFRLCTLRQCLLLPDGFIEAREERLVVAQVRGADPLPGALRKLFFILSAIALKFTQLHLAFRRATLKRCDALR